MINSQLLFQHLSNTDNKPKKKYLYSKLIEITDEILRTRANKLEQDIQSISKEHKSDWDGLIQWKLPSKYKKLSELSQCTIMNGIEPQFTMDELLQRIPIETSIHYGFEIDSFYDLNQYLSDTLILTHSLYPSFNKSVIKILIKYTVNIIFAHCYILFLQD